MSYDIYIGEAFIDAGTPEEILNEDDDAQIKIRVKGKALPDAPRFPGDIMTENGNSRHPGYSQWMNFLEEVGLHDVFFQRETNKGMGLMDYHPGAARICPHHLERVREAKQAWAAKHPDKIPGWDPNHGIFDKGDPDPKYDGNMARLIWLEWWFNWALTNCEIPTIYNR